MCEVTMRVTRLVDERGLAFALLAGWRAAPGPVLGVIEADLQHQPATLTQRMPEVVGRVSAPMSGAFLIRRQAVAGAVQRRICYKVPFEVIARATIGRIAEDGNPDTFRQVGDSTVSRQQRVDYRRHLWRLRRSAPFGWLVIVKSAWFRSFVKFNATRLAGLAELIAISMVTAWSVGMSLGLNWGTTASRTGASR